VAKLSSVLLWLFIVFVAIAIASRSAKRTGVRGGATKRQIMVQFLIESSVLCSIGGVLGLLLAAGVSSIVRSTTPVPMTITLAYVVLSVGVSSIIGMLFGIYPAVKAAKLDPIIALTKN